MRNVRLLGSSYEARLNFYLFLFPCFSYFLCVKPMALRLK
jgi:hypothetical protein